MKRKIEQWMSLLSKKFSINPSEATVKPIIRAGLFELSILQRNAEESKAAKYASPQLSALQHEIETCMRLEFGNDNNYTKAYKDQEIFYWYPVLRWIDELVHVNDIVDIGSAYGTLLVYAAKKHGASKLVAVDPCNYLAKSIAEKYGIRKITADIERENINISERYDLVMFTEVLEHLNFYPTSTLRKLHSLLNDDGYAIITTPDAFEWGRVTDHYSSLQSIPAYDGQTTTWFDGHIWQYTHEEAVSVIEGAGFVVMDWAYSKGVAARHLCYLLKKRA